MNLNLVFENVAEQEVDEDIIGDLVEISVLNIMQFKNILLQKNNQKKIEVIYKVLEKLIYIQEIQQFVFMIFEMNIVQFLPPYQLFQILQKLVIFPQYQKRILFGLINLWRQNYLRIPVLELINNIVLMCKQKQMFMFVYYQILQIFPIQINYQVQRQNAQKLNHLKYFDQLISQSIKFLFSFNTFVPQMKQQCIGYLISFSKINKFYKMIFFEIKKQLLCNTKSSHYESMLSILIKDNLFDYEMINEYNQILQISQYLYWKQISNVLKQFLNDVCLSIEQIQQRIRSILFHIRLTVNYFDDIQQAGIIVIEWLRLLQMLMDISEEEKKLIIYQSIFEVVEITKSIIKDIKILKMGISFMLINNIPYSIDTLILFINQQIIPDKLFIDIKDKIALLEDNQHKTILWKKIIQKLKMVQFSEFNDYGMVNLLGLEIVDDWRIDTNKLIEIHQRMLFQNKQHQLQDIQAIIQYISLHNPEEQINNTNI